MRFLFLCLFKTFIFYCSIAQTLFGVNLDSLPSEHYAIPEQIKENSKDYYVLTQSIIFPKLYVTFYNGKQWIKILDKNQGYNTMQFHHAPIPDSYWDFHFGSKACDTAYYELKQVLGKPSKTYAYSREKKVFQKHKTHQNIATDEDLMPFVQHIWIVPKTEQKYLEILITWEMGYVHILLEEYKNKKKIKADLKERNQLWKERVKENKWHIKPKRWSKMSDKQKIKWYENLKSLVDMLLPEEDEEYERLLNTKEKD